jgi:integrase
MAVYKRGNKWWIDCYNNEGQRIRQYGGPTRAVAVEVLKAVQGDIARGRFGLLPKQSMRFDAFAQEYLEKCSQPPAKAPASHRRDLVSLSSLLPYFGDRQLSDISSFLIEHYKAERIQKVKGPTINRELALLSHMFHKAVDWDLVMFNPLTKVARFPENPPRDRVISIEEFQKLLLACSGRLRPIVLTAAYTGLRQGEILALQWSHVDLERGVMNPPRSKRGKMCPLPIKGELLEALKVLDGERKSDFVFTSERTGRPFKSIRSAWETAVKQSGISLPPFHFHDLRHFFTTYFQAIGGSQPDAQGFLGHRTPVMTAAYSHSTSQSGEEAMERLAQRLDSKAVTNWSQKQVEQKENAS